MPFVDSAVKSLPELMSSAGLSDPNSQPENVNVDFDGNKHKEKPA